MSETIVITGMGIVSPIGCGETDFWNALLSGKSGAGPVGGFDTSELPRGIACQVRDPIDVDAPVGRASKLAIAAAREAIQSAGITKKHLDLRRTTITIGTTMGETEFIERRLHADDADWLSDEHVREIFTGQPGCIAESVRAELGVDAHPSDLYGACAAGNMAIASARRQLLSGECDLALVGGADGFSSLAFIGFMRARVMAEKVCRPFDQERDGLLVGEGAVVLVLERASDAAARGARARARITGTGLACEDYHPTRPHPEGDGLTRATLAALTDASLAPDDIDYLCAHGTGTPANDAIEVKVMQRVFPEGVRFSSIKALTGHPMGAASAVEVACCVLSIEHQTLIPTWHLDKVLEPHGDLTAIIGGPQSTTIRHAVNNSAGFGGYNASVILSEA